MTETKESVQTLEENFRMAVETEYFWTHGGSYYDDKSYVWKNMTLIKEREIMSIIDRFAAYNPHGKSP